MTVKTFGYLTSGIVRNLILLDESSNYNPSGVSLVDTTPSPNSIKIGQTFHVRAGAYTHNIVCDGNSIAAGVSGGSDIATEGCVTDAGLTVNDRYNVAISGRTTSVLISEAAAKVDLLYEYKLGTKNILMLWEVTNDINSGLTGAQAYANIKTYCQARKAIGWKIIVGTCTPRTNSSNANHETHRLACNQLIRDALANGETWLDAIADAGAAPLLQDPTNNTYYVTGLHLIAAGHAVAKPYFTTALTGLL